MNEDYSELERELDERLPDLGALYESDADEAVDEEHMRPILNALREQQGHYAEAVFVRSGGEKRIYKVRDLRTDRVVALAKPLEDAGDEEQERFLREGRVTACLQHPNIISIHDEGLDPEGEPFFTMEYVHGDTLKEIIGKLRAGDEGYARRYPLSRLLELFSKICDAVSYAHSRGVLHLDIKPSNVFIGPYGEALLCDWGLAKVFRKEEYWEKENVPAEELPNGDILNDLTKTGVIKGTPGFMAPEQLVSHGDVGRHTDVYSLGALLYFILVYRPPVSGDTLSEIAEQTRSGRVKRPSRVISGRPIPSGIEAVVMKALALAPEDRYASALAFREELDRYLTGYATRAQDASWLTRAGLLIKRRPFAFRVAIVSVVLLIGVFIVAFARVVGEKQRAEGARNEARESLRLYKQETEISRALSDSIRETALDFINHEDFLNARVKINAITSHLKQETDEGHREVLIEYLALLHFVVQDFQQSAAYFELVEVSQRYEACRDLAIRFGALKEDGDWLEPNDMVALLNELKRHIRYVAYYSAYYYLTEPARRLTPETILPVVEVMLDTLNNMPYSKREKSELVLEHRDIGPHLSLSGKPYSIFIMPIPVPIRQANVLRPLGLASLDVSHSGLVDVERLHGMLLIELNIAGIKTIPQHKFYVFERLKVERVYHTLDHPDRYLKKYAPGVEFIRLEK